jgi:hypothetical protein
MHDAMISGFVGQGVHRATDVLARRAPDNELGTATIFRSYAAIVSTPVLVEYAQSKRA